MTPLERYSAAFYTRWLLESKVTTHTWDTMAQVQRALIINCMQSALAAMSNDPSAKMLVKGGETTVRDADGLWSFEIGETAAGQVWRVMIAQALENK